MVKRINIQGVGVRGGNVAQLGQIGIQPIPFVLPGNINQPNNSPIMPVMAPPVIADNLRNNLPPVIRIPNGLANIGNIGPAIEIVNPQQIGQLQIRRENPNGALNFIRPEVANGIKPNLENLSVADLQIQDGLVSLVNENAISSIRPEIISVFDFKPIFDDGSTSFNEIGDFIEAQYQTRKLRLDTLERIFQLLKANEGEGELKNIEKEINLEFKKINDLVDFYSKILSSLESAKNSFYIKNIQEKKFLKRNLLPIRDFFYIFGGIPKENFNKFTNTKIMAQLTCDLKNICENYSLNLLNSTDNDRTNGNSFLTNATSIDTTYNTNNTFSFNLDTIRSYSNPINAATSTFFTKYNNSLPNNPEDRIKLNLAILSKEIRISRSLGRPKTKRMLTENFRVRNTDGSPFDNICGVAPNSIFSPFLGEKSMGSNFLFKVSDQVNVLPFESKEIKVLNEGKTYIPGSTFLVDGILKINRENKFNVAPLKSFVDSYSESCNNFSELINDLFDFSDKPSKLSAISLKNIFLIHLSDSIRFLGSSASVDDNNPIAIVAEAAGSSILKLSTTDKTLKLLVFQYLLLKLLYNQKTSTSILRKNIILDLQGDIRGLDGILFNEGNPLPNLENKNELGSYLNQLAISIQTRVATAVNRERLIPGRKAPDQNSIRRNNPATGEKVIGFDSDTVVGIPNALETSRTLEFLENFLGEVENILGNETGNIFEGQKRTRFNSLSTTTLALIAFETYIQLTKILVSSEFQSSMNGNNFPDMVINTKKNSLVLKSIKHLLNEKEEPIEILDNQLDITVKEIKNLSVGPQLNNSALNQGNNIIRNAQGNLDGILKNANLVAGVFATPGSQANNIGDLSDVSLISNPMELAEYQNLNQIMSDIRKKIWQEDLAVASAVNFYNILKTNLKNTLNNILLGLMNKTLEELVPAGYSFAEDVQQNITKSQIKLLVREKERLNRQLKEKDNLSQVLPNSEINNFNKEIIYSIFSNPEYLSNSGAANKIKLFTVGIPANCFSSLGKSLDSVSISEKDFSSDDTSEFVKIKVYKRNLNLPFLVFKPLEYIFDLSLFPEFNKFQDGNPKENKENFIKQLNFLDYSKLNLPLSVNFFDIGEKEKYLKLSKNQREELVRNHTLSEASKLYVQFLSGIKLEESTFFNLESRTYLDSINKPKNNTYEELVKKTLQKIRVSQKVDSIGGNILNLNLDTIANSKEIDVSTKDSISLLNSNQNIFNKNTLLGALAAPKKFDRVFNIPVNIDDFIINEGETTKTEGGIENFKNKKFQEMLVETKDGLKLRSRNENSINLEDFFVTMEII